MHLRIMELMLVIMSLCILCSIFLGVLVVHKMFVVQKCEKVSAREWMRNRYILTRRQPYFLCRFMALLRAACRNIDTKDAETT